MLTKKDKAMQAMGSHRWDFLPEIHDGIQERGDDDDTQHSSSTPIPVRRNSALC